MVQNKWKLHVREWPKTLGDNPDGLVHSGPRKITYEECTQAEVLKLVDAHLSTGDTQEIHLSQ